MNVWALYLVINILATLIWWTIPGCINVCRQKYGLPCKRIWPIPKNFQKDAPGAVIIVGMLIGSLCIVPLSILVMCVCGIYKCVNYFAFSKEEKVQIAVGSIEKSKRSLNRLNK